MLEVLMGDPHVDGDHPWHRAQRGELDATEIQGQLGPYATAHGVTLHGDEIDVILGPKDYGVQDLLLARITSLRDEGYRTALVTNSFTQVPPRPWRSCSTCLSCSTSWSTRPRSGPASRRSACSRSSSTGWTCPPTGCCSSTTSPAISPAPRAAGLRTIHVTDVHAALTELDAVLSGA